MLYDKERWEPKTQIDEVDQLILKLANYFEAGGRWCQYRERSNNGAVCMVGGLAKMELRSKGFIRYCNEGGSQENEASSTPLTDRALDRLAAAIDDMYAGNHCVTNWNDTTGRTKKEVIDLLRKVGNKG